MAERQFIVIGIATIRHYEDPDESFLITRILDESELGALADEYFCYDNQVGIYISGHQAGKVYNKYTRIWREKNPKINQWGSEETDFDEISFKEIYELKPNPVLLLMDDFVSQELKLKVEVFQTADSKEREELLEQKERELFERLKEKYGD
ncbi:MAG: hypothetical protein UT24_C0019G0008 [Candidatus Woesebacteria bacterium GW2011_GWB1_39_12]|uniref:Uncharacterized protein n=1 Tax=Candidatus Woesebacteria bacterium GW2011_GWB1_39_12 TaxID=1618574 RepID=A0A0G0M739_9BACT|nr:MAG: hypothetical protein UT24_C0019G0008 [Candidatus Woesebacteria bacterium GW2011_GWB1_39_12]